MWRGLILLFLFVGCGHSDYLEQQRRAYLEMTTVYKQAVAARASQPPLLHLTLHPDGRLASISVSHEVKYPNVPTFQPAPHPGWKFGGKALGAASVLGGIYLTGQALENLVDSVGSTTNTTTSYDGNFDSSFNNGNTSSQIGSQGFIMDRNNGEFQYGGGSDGQSYKPRGIPETIIEEPINEF